MGRPKTTNSAREDFKVTRCHNLTIQRLMRDFDSHSKKLEFYFNSPLIYDVRVRVDPELFTPLRANNIRYFDLPVYQIIFGCEEKLDYRTIKDLFRGIVDVLAGKRKSISVVKGEKFKGKKLNRAESSIMCEDSLC